MLGIVVNLLLATGKCVVGTLGHSFALISDGIESLTDVVSSSIVVAGLFWAARPPDKDHPYGHGKAEPIAALVVSLSLLGAAVFIALESIAEIRTPHRLPAPYTLIVVIAVVVIKGGLSRYVGVVGKEIESGAVRADAWHHFSDALTSGFAFVGISIALVSRYPAADDWAALCASPVILFNGLKQMRGPLGELLDASPPGDIEAGVRETALTVSGVLGLDKCFVRKMGFEYYVDIHVLVDGARSVTDGHRIAHEVEDAVLEAQPSVADVLVHIEPTEETRY